MARDKQLPPGKKAKKLRKQQEKAKKPLAVGRILIVCDGEKTDAFELWYLLHFSYRDTGFIRDQYKAELTTWLGKEYKKNDETMYETLLAHPKADQQQAIRYAEKLSKLHVGQKNYADHNPSTTVHELVECLNDLAWQFRCQVDPAYPLPYAHDCNQCKKSAQPPPPYLCSK